MRVYFHTFGCKANQYDTEVVRQALEAQGVEPVDDPSRADVAVVNSCTVTQSGEARMRSLVRRLNRERPELRTVVMGCAAAVDDGVIAALPGVSNVVGGADPAPVLRALDLDDTRIDPVLRRFSGGSRAWVKIQDGCDEHCTFCATTIARGANRSRPEAEIFEECRGLAESHDEIVLTGVHIGTYGRDVQKTLSGLVEKLVRTVPRVRFRLTSVEATEVDDRLIDLMVSDPDRMAPHLHAPLQSGSDRVLKRMGRHWYTSASYRERIETMAQRLPVFGLGADIIVGFPGETEEDHRATASVVADLPFTYLHVFPYSPRPDASAQRLGPAVHGTVAAERSAALRTLGKHSAQAYRAGRRPEADVVVIGRQRGRIRGLTEDYLEVYLGSESSMPPARRFPAIMDLSGDETPVVTPVEVAV